MYNLSVRKIDDSTIEKLKHIAQSKGIGLETLAREVLINFSLSPEINFIDDKYRNLSKDMIALYQSAIDENIEVIKENNYLIKKIISFLENLEE